MKVKKSWYSYILWVLFSIILFTSACIGAIEISQADGSASFIVPLAVIFGGCIVGFCAFIFGFKILDKYLGDKIHLDKMVAGPTVEITLISVISIVAAAIRVVTILQTGNAFENKSVIYEFINGTATASMPTVQSGAFIYAYLLKFVMGFLGFKVSSVIILQTVLQIIGFFLLFYTVKTISGQIGAWVSLLLYAFLPGSYGIIKICTQDILLVDLIFVFILLLALLAKKGKEVKLRENWNVIFYLLLGAFGGFIAYFDYLGLVLIPIAVCVFFSNKPEDKWLKIHEAWFQSLMLFIGFAAAFALLVMNFSFKGVGGSEALSMYFSGFTGLNLNLTILSPNAGYKDCLVLFILGGLWLFEFLRSADDKGFVVISLIFASTLFTFIGCDCSDYIQAANSFWICLSGIAFENLHVFRLREGEEEENLNRKYEKEIKKRAKQNKIAAGKGEKFISLDVSENTKASESTSALSSDNNKGYGIGMKKEQMQTEPVIATQPKLKPITENATETDSMNTTQNNDNVNTGILNSVEDETEVKFADSMRPENTSFEDRSNKPPIAIGYGSYRKKESVHASIESETEQTDDITKSNVAGTAETVRSEAVKEREVKIDNTVTYVRLSSRRGKMFTPVRKADETPSEADSNNQNQDAMRQTATTVSTVKDVNVQPVASAPAPVSAPAQGAPQVTLGVGFSSSYAQSVSYTQRLDLPDEDEEISTPVAEQSINNEETVIKKITRPIMTRDELIDSAQTTASADAGNVIADKNKSVVNADTKQKASVNKPVPGFIKNPLPTPKPHVTKELDYDYTPTEAEMRFDIDDLRGREYYDI